MKFIQVLTAVAALAAAFTPGPSFADNPSPAKEEIHTAYVDLQAAAVHGPASILLLSEGSLALPKGMMFADHGHGKRLMEALGNQVDDQAFVGLILPEKGQGHWFVTVDYAAEGHVSDSDASDINADHMLKVLKDGTEHSNEFRKSKGMPAIEMTGWAEPPAYNAIDHTLVWSALVREHGAALGSEQTVNFNTRVLGREGYFLVDMIDGQSDIAEDKPYARQILDATKFNEGKRYTDFNASTDHVAAYGLAALIGGVAAKKIGLLAMAGVFLAKAWKLALVGFAVASGAVRKLFRRSPTA
jgi:uncharacterized membrane-anchored protein